MFIFSIKNQFNINFLNIFLNFKITLKMRLILLILFLSKFSSLLPKALVNNSTIVEKPDFKSSLRNESKIETKIENDLVRNDEYSDDDYYYNDEEYSSEKNNDGNFTLYPDGGYDDDDDDTFKLINEKDMENDFQTIVRNIMGSSIFSPRVRNILDCVFIVLVVSFIVYFSVKKRKLIPLLYNALRIRVLKKKTATNENTPNEVEISF